MDYEKKYKESMAKMSTFLAKHDGLTISKYSKMYKELSEIFDELKESEGERIWIINYLNNRIVNSTIIAEKENLKRAIAWLENQGEQMPAWSEEDKMQLDAAIHIVANSGHTCTSDWLKHLKDRVQPQQKWSEEDEKYLKLAIDNFQTKSTASEWL